jgi:hypothetical protein
VDFKNQKPLVFLSIFLITVPENRSGAKMAQRRIGMNAKKKCSFWTWQLYH